MCVGCRNSIEHLIAILAVIAAGKTWVALNPRNGDPELQRIVEFTEPAALLLDEAMAARIDGGGAATYMLDGAPADTVFGRAAKADVRFTADLCAARRHGRDQIHRRHVRHAERRDAALPRLERLHRLPAPRLRFYAARPVSGQCAADAWRLDLHLADPWRRAARSCFPQDTRPATLLHTIAEHDVTTFFAPPTMIQMLVDAARDVNMPTPSLRNVIYGGAPMRPNRIVEAQDAFGPVIARHLRTDRSARRSSRTSARRS